MWIKCERQDTEIVRIKFRDLALFYETFAKWDIARWRMSFSLTILSEITTIYECVYENSEKNYNFMGIIFCRPLCTRLSCEIVKWNETNVSSVNRMHTCIFYLGDKETACTYNFHLSQRAINISIAYDRRRDVFRMHSKFYFVIHIYIFTYWENIPYIST